MTNKTVVVSVTIAVVWLITAIAVLMVEGKDPTQLITFVSPFLTMLVPVLITAMKVDKIDKNVNGHLSDLSRAAGIKPSDTPDKPTP